MKFFEKLFFVTIAAGLALTTACSDDPKDTSSKQGVEGACEHINSVCGATQGFKQQDCSATNAAYAGLSAADKAKTDAIVPCVMAATSCQPALDCVRGPSSSSTPNQSNNNSQNNATDAEAACEHINDVCSGQSGFKTQDCSASNEGYAKLSVSEKQTADSIAPCIMDAQSCESAFACLKQLESKQ